MTIRNRSRFGCTVEKALPAVRRECAVEAPGEMAVVEFARNVLGYTDAASTEVDPDTAHPVIDMMEDQKKTTIKGGTMRLGAYKCRLAEGSLARRLYGCDEIAERHRHRYEFNDAYRAEMTAAGLSVSGSNPETGLVEIIEIPSHPFFIATQFHPEYKSTPEKPQPLFTGFIRASIARREQGKGKASGNRDASDPR